MLEGVKVALIHGLLFVEVDLAHEFAVIAADNIRIVFRHRFFVSLRSTPLEIFELLLDSPAPDASGSPRKPGLPHHHLGKIVAALHTAGDLRTAFRFSCS
jgi:hypothetical protein